MQGSVKTVCNMCCFSGGHLHVMVKNAKFLHCNKVQTDICNGFVRHFKWL